MTYEKDYRKRILNFYYKNGKTKTLFQFNISSSTLYGWIKLKKETGDLSFCISFTINNGFVEGKNNKIKVIKRLSYGIKKIDNLKKLIQLRIS